MQLSDGGVGKRHSLVAFFCVGHFFGSARRFGIGFSVWSLKKNNGSCLKSREMRFVGAAAVQASAAATPAVAAGAAAQTLSQDCLVDSLQDFTPPIFR